ncbi:LysR family transcriptional regulator [Denitromonas sp.]|uniref:LysR family transcriptional regulator n=1 Tax=Denitromonas sp. TaxID=2734609 RepID=UPI003A855EE8
MRRKIPSTGALIAFEAAARHESFTRAAEELSLTQGAICRQIASLEEFVGVALFKRARRGVKLTDAGLSYSRQVASRLDAVERDTLSVMGHHAGGRSIELAVVPTFATRWLLPRLSDFLAGHPEASVNLSTRTRPFLFAETDFDAAIYFGDADWPGTQAHFLMHENPVPVCSPRLLPPGPHTAATLAEAPLLQQSTRPYAWRQWFETQGIRAARDLHGPRLELFSMLAQAAMHDMGVALIPPFLIQDELASGRLVVPVDATYDSGKAYYLMIPERKTEAALLGAFRHWLMAEIAAFVGAPADQSSSAANASSTRE